MGKKLVNKGGRPTGFTKEVLDKLEYAFALGCTDKEAALYAGVTPDAIAKHGVRHPEFVKRKRLLKETPVLKAREAAVKKSTETYGNAIDFLSRIKKDEFSSRPDSESTHQTLVINLTKEQEALILGEGE